MQTFKLKLSSTQKFVEAKVNLILKDSDLNKILDTDEIPSGVPPEILTFIDIDNIEITVTPELAQYGVMKNTNLSEEAQAVLTPNAKSSYKIQEKWYGLLCLIAWLKGAPPELLDSNSNNELIKMVKDPNYGSTAVNKSFNNSDTKDAIFKFETIMNVPVDADETVASFVDAFENQVDWTSKTTQTIKVKFYYEPRAKVENPQDLVDIHSKNENENDIKSPEFEKKFNEIKERYKVMIDYLKKIGEPILIDPNWTDPKWLADKADEELNQ